MARTLKARKPSAKKVAKAQILVMGPPGVGKTWLSIDFPDALLVDCEGGAKRAEYQQKLEEAGALILSPEDGDSNARDE